jgi:hypothetical protein
MNTLHTPVPTTKWRELVVHSWQLLTMFKLQKIRYAIKCSIAATLLASPAFFQATGAWFREWRMEWALITVSKIIFIYIYF